jgi:NAD(P)-dependent dehydrogenase (short-subunit alcohol dehydrogenase family)
MPGNDAAVRKRLVADANLALKRSHPHKKVRAEDIELVLIQLDLASMLSIDRAVKTLKTTGVLVNCLINNAGLAPIKSDRTAEGFELSFGVNYIGTAYFTQQLKERGVLVRVAPDNPAVVVMVSSEEHRLVPVMLNESTKEFGLPEESSVFTAMDRYAYSKLALTTYAHELNRRWEDVVVRDICPGKLNVIRCMSIHSIVNPLPCLFYLCIVCALLLMLLLLAAAAAAAVVVVVVVLLLLLGPVASGIAQDAPWPINVAVVALMKLAFPDPLEASLAVLNLADGGETRPGVHWHMAEPRTAGMGAGDHHIGMWLWDKTQELLRSKSPSHTG